MGDVNLEIKLSNLDERVIKIEESGGGSGGDLKPYIVQFTCDSGYIGQTLTMTYKGTPQAGETVDNVSGTVASDGALTLYPMHSGNWECSCYSSVIGTTMKKTIELSYWGTTNVEFNDIPDGATVTPTDDVQTWLHCANIWNKSYTTIPEVVADTTTLNTLIANENASDYLVRSTTFVTDICSNESAMTYIGLNNYCANKLLANSTWLEAICNSAYFEKVLNVRVPTMNSNTGDDGGEVFGDTYSTSYPTYYAFDKKPNTKWLIAEATQGTKELGYKFPKLVCIKKIKCTAANESSYVFPAKINVMGYDGSTWKPIKEVDGKNLNNLQSQDILLPENTTKYIQYKLVCTSRLLFGDGSYYSQFSEVQLYGREEV